MMVENIKEDLPVFIWEDAISLRDKVKNRLIEMTYISVDKMSTEDNVDSVEDSLNRLDKFIIDINEPAFYLKINDKAGADTWGNIIDSGLEKIKNEMDTLIGRDKDMGEDMLKRLKMFKKSIVISKKALSVRKAIIKKNIDMCNTVEDIQRLVQKEYAGLIADKIIDPIVHPIYDGLSQFKNAPKYKILGDVVNEFFKNLGIYTEVIKVGDKFNFSGCYNPEASNEENTTKNENLKDVVKSVNYYAYCFYEPGSANEHSPVIKCGEAEVWRYDP